MEEHRLPEIVLYGELSPASENTLKRSLAICTICRRQWTTQATNRSNWRGTVYQATISHETTRMANMEDKRRRRRNRNPSEATTEQTVVGFHQPTA